MAKTIANSKQTSADIANQRIARIYAQALVDAAVQAGNDELIMSEFASIIDNVFDPFPALEDLFASALITFDEKAAVLDRIFGNRVAPLLLSFLKVVGRHDRLSFLRTIRHEAVNAYHHRYKKVPVKLRVAVDTDSQLTSTICHTFCDVLGVEPILETTIDPALLAGFTMTIGDTIYDGSVRTQFRNTRDAIVEKAIQMIQAQRTAR